MPNLNLPPSLRVGPFVAEVHPISGRWSVTQGRVSAGVYNTRAEARAIAALLNRELAKAIEATKPTKRRVK